MKYVINQISAGEDELILNYLTESPEVERIIRFMNGSRFRLTGKVEDETVAVNPENIIYIESVEEKTFAYTEKSVIRLDHPLVKLEDMLTDEKYFRCSKSIIMNVDKVQRLKSLPSNRIEAVMEGDYRIIISRKFASEFRRLLKGN